MSQEADLSSLYWAIERYFTYLADDELNEVYLEIQKHNRGEAKCNCPQCLDGLATRANQIADWISYGSDPVRWYRHPLGFLHWYLEESGEIMKKLEGGNGNAG